MAGYWMIRSSDIVDQGAYDEYAKLWGPLAKQYGASIIAGRGTRNETREGAAHARALIIEFESFEQAVACYDCAEYQAAMVFASKAMTYRDLVIVESS